MEDKVILANLLRKYSIEAVDTFLDTRPAGLLILKPLTNSIRVKLHRRK